ncbi:MAG: hypothetical protein V4497_09870 [Bacteroidota bacterium]
MNNLTTYKTTVKWIKPLFLVMFFVVFSFSGFAQSPSVSTLDVNGNDKPTANIKLESSRATSNMEFALWFMGSKQDPNATMSTEGTNTKKLIMTSGMAPNRLLIKAFLKKVVNYENSLS